MSPITSASHLDSELSRLRIDKSKKKRRRKSPMPWIIVLLLIGGGGGGFAYYQKNLAPIEVKVASATAPIAAGSPAALAAPSDGSVLTAGGYVIPRNSIMVTSKIVARVREVLVKRGDVVKKGDVLIRLDDSDYIAQTQMSKARLGSMHARLEQLKAGARAQEIQAAQGIMEAARATMQGAKDDLDRMSSLDAGAILSVQELHRARTVFNVASANFESAQRNYELVKAGPRKEEIDAAAAAESEARASVDYAQTQLDLTIIHAPVDGTILEKVAEIGELVTNANYGGTNGPQTSVVKMADLKDLQVEIDLNESDIAKLHMDQDGEIRLDSVPDAVFHGKVDEIAPQADRQKGTVQVKVRVLDPSEKIRPEAQARVTFLDASATSASTSTSQTERMPNTSPGGTVRGVRIPVEAVQGTGSDTRVFVVREGIARETKIKVGKTAEGNVEVLDGLLGRETIVLSPPEKLSDGRKVTVKS